MNTNTALENPRKLFPMFITPDLAETKAFYVDKLGWRATYDTDGYLQVRRDAKDGPELCFMSPAATGDALPRFEGKGVLVSVPVTNADEHHAFVVERGVEPITKPDLKPWGWRSYNVADPNGVVLDFFHVAAPPTMAPND